MDLHLIRGCDEYIAVGCCHKSPMTSLPARPSPASPSKSITVVDVYDLAASIGKDFEKLIQLYGNDCVRGIMPKVISALETLEAMANGNERDNEEVIELRKTVDRLESEKHAKMQDRIKFDEELEQCEENYRKEIDELRQMVKSLMSENRSLSNTVSSIPQHIDSPTTNTVREEDIKAMFELKETAHKQKEEMKQLQKDVHHYSCEVDNLTNNIEKLIRQNEELLRKNGSLQKQGRMIVEEKIELVKRLERTEEENIKLQALLSDTNRTCMDLREAKHSDDEPRFTLAELREVLQEKNVLKGRVMELEEELDSIRPGGPRECEGLSLNVSEAEEAGEECADSEDLPVYGPMPKEPEEKLYPWKYERKDAGVRRFFKFFKDLGGSARDSPESPRRASRVASAASSPRVVRRE